MNLLELLGANFAATAVLLFLVWLLSVRLSDVSIVDVFWGLGFTAIAALSGFLTADPSPRKFLIITLTSLWGLRLSAYLAWRKFGTPEDHRYRSMRESIGSHFWLVSLFVVFGLQGIIMNIVALPVMAGELDGSPLNGWAVLGIGLWGVGILFETVGDYQLARFKANPINQGKVMDRGLWRYTRHPNYFGDFMVWWGIYFAALSQSTWWTAIGPMVMSFLLLRVSGVTLLERSLQRSKVGYADYIARTSSFFPWPPRPPV
jgi:steroid 5-alpha reductase family enzyme